MKNKIKIIVRLVILCFVIQSQAQDKQTIMKEKGISISDFNAEHISDKEIKITIDYSYVGKTDPKKYFIYAFLQDEGGNTMSRHVNTESIPLKTGNNQVSFMIKKQTKKEDFTSKSINICMFDIKRKMYCQEFLFTKFWKESSSEVKIISFNSNKTQVNIGEQVTLTWQTENANTIHILEKNTENIIKVEASGAMTVNPDKTTTYLLIVGASSEKSGGKQEIKSVTISINSPPEITDFRAEPQNINKGDPVRFYWDVKNANNVQLYDSYGEINSVIELPNGELSWPLIINGEYIENLNKSETYILRATNNIGEVEKVFKVTVKGKKID